jgi:RES domain-containing protein
VQLWRLIKAKYASTAFDGEGARIYGARWNSPGTRVAYAADNSALAVLEVLVHLKSYGILSSYSMVTATIPERLVEDIDKSSLPVDWNSSPVPPQVQAIGDDWIRTGASLALRVPSAIVPGSNNVLINPEHLDFAHFSIEATEPFAFDLRLLRPRAG